MSGKITFHEFRVGGFAEADAPAGKVIRVNLGDIPKQVEGRPLHLMAVRLDVQPQHDAVAATMPAAMPGYLLKTCIRDIVLEAGSPEKSHRFVDSVDGYDLWLDELIRTGETRQGVSSDIADADATDTEAAEQQLELWCCNPNADPDYRLDGVIPMIGFESRTDRDLRFTVAANYDGFAGVTIDNLDVEVYAICVALDKLRFPTAWRMRTHLTQDLISYVQPFGPIRYCVVNTRVNSAGTNTRDLSGYGRLALDIGDRRLYEGADDDDVTAQALLNRKGAHDDLTITEATPEFLALVLPGVGTPRGKLPEGNIRFESKDRTAHAQTRILLREEGFLTQTLTNALAFAAGAPKGQNGHAAVHLEPVAGPGAMSAQGILDSYVFWDGMPFAEPRRHLGRRAA